MITDLYLRASTDDAFYAELEAHMSRITEFEEDLSLPARQRETAIYEEIKQVYELCDYNPGLLVPWFFPSYPEDKPLSFVARPFSFAMTDVVTHGYTAIRGGRQIAKTTSLIARQLINQEMLPNWKSLYIAPHPTQAETYAVKMLEMQRQFRFYKTDHKLRQNMYFKEHANGGTIEIENVLMSASHIHGKTADEVLFDEYQFFDPDFEQEILAVQASRQLKVRIYAGTALTLDSPLEERYQASSQGRWLVRDGTGANYLDMSDKDTLIKIMAPDGPRCPKTRRPLEMGSGFFDHAYPERLKERRVGYHVPRLIVPDFAHDIGQWQEIWEIFEGGDMPAFLKTVGGIPVESGLREITEADLKAMCVLGPGNMMAARVLKEKRYRRIISGSDWGGTEFDPVNKVKTSFSAHVILGDCLDGNIDILYMKKYSGQDYEVVADQMARIHNYLGGFAYGSDAGVGTGYNNKLREQINPNRHLVLNLVGPNTAPISTSKGSQYFNLFNLNKTEAITALISDIKANKIRCYDWPDASYCLLDFLNSFRVPTESIHGRRYFRYLRPPSKSDDVFLACMFAHAVLRYCRGERLIQDAAVAASLRQRFMQGDSGLGVRRPGSRLVSG